MVSNDAPTFSVRMPTLLEGCAGAVEATCNLVPVFVLPSQLVAAAVASAAKDARVIVRPAVGVSGVIACGRYDMDLGLGI